MSEFKDCAMALDFHDGARQRFDEIMFAWNPNRPADGCAISSVDYERQTITTTVPFSVIRNLRDLRVAWEGSTESAMFFGQMADEYRELVAAFDAEPKP